MKLPQFVKSKPHDINKMLGWDNFTKDNAKVVFESNPENAPEELKHLPRDIDPNFNMPLPYRKKTHTYPREAMRLAVTLRRKQNAIRKFKERK